MVRWRRDETRPDQTFSLHEPILAERPSMASAVLRAVREHASKHVTDEFDFHQARQTDNSLAALVEAVSRGRMNLHRAHPRRQQQPRGRADKTRRDETSSPRMFRA